MPSNIGLTNSLGSPANLPLCNGCLHQLLEQATAGIILLDAHQNITYINHSAQALLSSNGRLFLKNGKLYMRDSGSQAELQSLLTTAQELTQTQTNSLADTMVGILSGTGAHLALSVIPLSLLGQECSQPDKRIATAILVNVLEKDIQISQTVLQRLYGLTPREAQLCQEFVNEVDLSKVAHNMNLKLSSVRSLLRNTFYKTEQTTQAGLMRLLVSLQMHARFI